MRSTITISFFFSSQIWNPFPLLFRNCVQLNHLFLLKFHDEFSSGRGVYEHIWIEVENQYENCRRIGKNYSGTSHHQCNNRMRWDFNLKMVVLPYQCRMIKVCIVYYNCLFWSQTFRLVQTSGVRHALAQRLNDILSCNSFWRMVTENSLDKLQSLFEITFIIAHVWMQTCLKIEILSYDSSLTFWLLSFLENCQYVLVACQKLECVWVIR